MYTINSIICTNPHTISLVIFKLMALIKIIGCNYTNKKGYEFSNQNYMFTSGSQGQYKEMILG